MPWAQKKENVLPEIIRLLKSSKNNWQNIEIDKKNLREIKTKKFFLHTFSKLGEKVKWFKP